MTDIAELSFDINSRDARRASDDLDDLSQSADRAGKEVDDLGRKTKGAGKNTKDFADNGKRAGGAVGGLGRNAGMAGIQIQQLVGQIQGGQSAFVALSQQAADLGFVLGAPMVGVIVSLGAVIAGTLVKAFNSTEKAVEELLPDIDKLRDNLDGISEEQSKYLQLINSREQVEAKKKIEDLNKALSDEGLYLLELRQNLDFAYTQDWQDRVDKYTKKVAEQEEKVQGIRAAIQGETQDLAQLGREMDILLGKSVSDATPWWGGDEAVEKEAAAIRMANMIAESKERQRIIEEGQAFGQMMFQRDLMLKEEAKAASDQALLDRELEFRNQMTAIYGRSLVDGTALLKETLAERMEAAIIAQQNEIATKQNLASAYTTFMESESKALFRIGQLGAAAQALNSADEAAAKALTLGPIAGPIAAGIMWTAGAARAYSIANRKFGDTSGSGPSTTPVNVPTDNSTTQNVQITVNAPNGDGGSIAAAIQDLFDSGRMRIQGGGVVSV